MAGPRLQRDARVTKRTFHALAGAYEALASKSTPAPAARMLRRKAHIEEMAGLEKQLPRDERGNQPDGGWSEDVFERAHLLFAEAIETDDPQLGEPGRGVWQAEQIGVALARAEAAYHHPTLALAVLDTLIEYVTTRIAASRSKFTNSRSVAARSSGSKASISARSSRSAQA